MTPKKVKESVESVISKPIFETFTLMAPYSFTATTTSGAGYPKGYLQCETLKNPSSSTAPFNTDRDGLYGSAWLFKNFAVQYGGEQVLRVRSRSPGAFFKEYTLSEFATSMGFFADRDNDDLYFCVGLNVGKYHFNSDSSAPVYTSIGAFTSTGNNKFCVTDSYLVSWSNSIIKVCNRSSKQQKTITVPGSSSYNVVVLFAVGDLVFSTKQTTLYVHNLSTTEEITTVSLGTDFTVAFALINDKVIGLTYQIYNIKSGYFTPKKLTFNASTGALENTKSLGSLYVGGPTTGYGLYASAAILPNGTAIIATNARVIMLDLTLANNYKYLTDVENFFTFCSIVIDRCYSTAIIYFSDDGIYDTYIYRKEDGVIRVDSSGYPSGETGTTIDNIKKLTEAMVTLGSANEKFVEFMFPRDWAPFFEEIALGASGKPIIYGAK